MENNILIYEKLKNFGRRIKYELIHSFLIVSINSSRTGFKNRIRKKIKKNEKISVYFIMQYPEMWNSEKSVYLAFLQDEMFITKIITIPKQIGVSHSDGEFCTVNEASEFCKKLKYSYIDARLDNKWISENELDCDIMFIQRPYDECMPEYMSLKNLSSHGLLAYIPYGFDFTKDVHLRIEYNCNFFNYIYYYFADNNETYEYVTKRSCLDIKMGIRRTYDLGYPRFDFLSDIKTLKSEKKCALWIPRWSVDNINDRTYFFDYFDLLMDYFSIHKERTLIIRPHPLMFKNFLEKGVLTEEAISDIRCSVDNMSNVSWDDNEDYLITFQQSDLMISDFSSLMIEYFATLKPLLYCGANLESFNNIGLEMAKGLYHIHDAKELLSTLEKLFTSSDIYYERNRDLVYKRLRKSSNIGLIIKDTLKYDLINL